VDAQRSGRPSAEGDDRRHIPMPCVGRSIGFLRAPELGPGCAHRDGALSVSFTVGCQAVLASSYSGMGGIRVIPTYGEPLGEAFVPPCDEDDGFRIEAVRIVGVDPKIAFAPDREETIFIADGVNELPPSLQRLRRPPRCDHGEAPVELTGQWLGIVDPGVDLIPPYRLQMRVDLATVSHYERTFPTIRVESELRRPLRRRDLRSSLWQGGSISVTATCVRGQFHAQEVAALPA
jgi:hypothetical protein